MTDLNLTPTRHAFLTVTDDEGNKLEITPTGDVVLSGAIAQNDAARVFWSHVRGLVVDRFSELQHEAAVERDALIGELRQAQAERNELKEALRQLQAQTP